MDVLPALQPHMAYYKKALQPHIQFYSKKKTHTTEIQMAYMIYVEGDTVSVEKFIWLLFCDAWLHR